MDKASLARLVTLGALWGISFTLQRVGVPVFGPTLVAELRLGSAALFLGLIALISWRSLRLAEHWQHYCIVGLVNSALPFLLFAYAAQTVPASMLAIFNSLAPLWGAIIAYFWLNLKVSVAGIVGLAMGFAGVVVVSSGTLVNLAVAPSKEQVVLALLAGIAAPFCYGLSSTFIKSRVSLVDPFANAHGSMWAASLWLLPMAAFSPMPASVPISAAAAVLGLGIVCTGVAYLLSFRLIADLGPMKAMTVSFLVPVFGIFWGVILLGEAITVELLVGAPLVIIGTGLATGLIGRRADAVQ